MYGRPGIIHQVHGVGEASGTKHKGDDDPAIWSNRYFPDFPYPGNHIHDESQEISVPNMIWTEMFKLSPDLFADAGLALWRDDGFIAHVPSVLRSELLVRMATGRSGASHQQPTGMFDIGLSPTNQNSTYKTAYDALSVRSRSGVFDEGPTRSVRSSSHPLSCEGSYQWLPWWISGRSMIPCLDRPCKTYLMSNCRKPSAQSSDYCSLLCCCK